MDFILAGSLLLKSKPSNRRSSAIGASSSQIQAPHTSQNHEEMRQMYRTPSDSSVESSKQQNDRFQNVTATHSPASAESKGSAKYNSCSPPSWYALPAPPTLYGGRPYVPYKDNQPVEADRISANLPRQSPAQSRVSAFNFPSLPPVATQASPIHQYDPVPTAGAIKPLHVWPEYAVPEYNSTMPR